MLRLAVSFCVIAATIPQALGQGCTSSFCQNSGICILVAGRPACACASGFTGKNCEIVEGGGASACATSPCLNGGSCQPVGDQFKCNCAPGWIGTICQAAVATTPPPTVATTTSAPGVTTPPPTTAAPTTPRPACPATGNTANPGCNVPAEVVFMIEYARGDTGYDVDHEGDFIKQLVDMWNVSSNAIRIGIVTYHDTVSDVIHIDDYADAKFRLEDAITRLTRRLRPAGTNDLAGALDYVKTTSFGGARPGAQKFVIPIVHMMPENDTYEQTIIDAAQRLKDDCVTIIGLGVLNSRSSHVQTTTDDIVEKNVIEQVVTSPAATHYSEFRDFTALEGSASRWDDANCGGAAGRRR